MVHVVTCNPALPEIVRAALKTRTVAHCPSGTECIEKILGDPNPTRCCVIVDLTTVQDGEHLMNFIQSSPSIHNIPIVAVGTRDKFDALDEGVEYSLNGVITLPCTPSEIATVVATVCEIE